MLRMKRVVDILLILILVAAITYLFFVLGAETGGIWFSTPAPGTRTVPAASATATITKIVTRAPGQGGTPTPTIKPTLTPTLTRTPSATATATFTATPTSSKTPTPDPIQAALDAEISAGIERGNQIIEALEAYYQAKGIYPPALNSLVPGYLAEIPVTITGQQFFYRPFDGESLLAQEIYWVAFNVTRQEHVACIYLRGLEYWDCGSTGP